MTAKEYLQQLHKADVIINQRLQEKADIRARLSCIKGLDYSNERVQAGPTEGAGYEREIIKITELEEEIDHLLNEYIALKHKIIGEIHGLKNSKYIEILYKRYVEDKRLEVVAVEMNYTFQYIVMLHGYALREFSEKYSIYFLCNSVVS